MSEESTFGSRLKHAWNAFLNRDPTEQHFNMPKEDEYGLSYFSRPDRFRFSRGNEKSIVTSILNRIAIDASSVEIKHVRLDENNRFIEELDTGLNNCLTVEANIDQSSRAFLQDAVMSLLDEGCIAIVPVETSIDPCISNSYNIEKLRVGKITKWFPSSVQILLYDERDGKRKEIILPKKNVAIIENPFYSVMNEPNSTMQRLIRKLNLLDVFDEQTCSGKLDIIIQLPYVIKTEARRAEAEKRRRDIENQLAGSQYGIAYTDGTEHITQLNRPAENNFMSQIEYLTNLLFSQLGLTIEILNGTADVKTMTNYQERTIEPIVSAIVDEIKRKFLTKTARSQKQSIKFFKDPFKLVPVSDISEMADKFTRNEIMTSNEIRQVIGMKPSNDPEADELRNKNLSKPKEEIEADMKKANGAEEKVEEFVQK